MIDTGGILHCIIKHPTQEQEKVLLALETDGLAEKVVFAHNGSEIGVSRTDVYIHTSSSKKREEIQQILRNNARRGLI